MRRANVLGREVGDCHGLSVGTVVDTYPYDGGGEVELVVLRLGRLGERRMLPMGALVAAGLGLRTPYARWQVEDSPALDGGRHGAEEPHRARSYWSCEEPVGRVPARWQPSSGSFATARRCRTTPGPTPSAS